MRGDFAVLSNSNPFFDDSIGTNFATLAEYGGFRNKSGGMNRHPTKKARFACSIKRYPQLPALARGCEADPVESPTQMKARTVN